MLEVEGERLTWQPVGLSGSALDSSRKLTWGKVSSVSNGMVLCKAGWTRQEGSGLREEVIQEKAQEGGLRQQMKE